MPNLWHYRLLGEEFGPVPQETIKSLLEAGTLSETDELRREGSSTWITAAQALPSTTHTASSAVSPDDELQWFYRVAGEERGPVSFHDLVRFAETGKLTADDEIRYGTTGKWRKVGTLGRLVAVLPFRQLPHSPAPTSSTAASSPSSATVSSAVGPSTRPEFEQAEWYAWIRGVECGPVSLAELSHWRTTGQLTAANFVKQGSTGTWLPVSSIPGLCPQTTRPAALPPPLTTPPHVPAPPATPSAPQNEPAGAEPARTVAEPERAPRSSAASSSQPVAAPPQRPASPEERPPKAPLSEHSSATHSTRSPATDALNRLAPTAGSPPPKPTPRPTAKTAAHPASHRGDVAAAFRQPKVLFLFAAVAFGVLIYFVSPLLFRGKGGDIKKLQTLQHILADYRQIQDQRGGSEWSAFASKAQQTAEPIVKELEKTASRREPQKQYMLWATRDRLPTMLTGDAKTAQAAADEFEANLNEAAKLLGVASGDPTVHSPSASATAEPPNREQSSDG